MNYELIQEIFQYLLNGESNIISTQLFKIIMKISNQKKEFISIMDSLF
jgi:hypothetical protein